MEYRSIFKDDLLDLDRKIERDLVRLDHKIDTAAGDLRLEIKDAKVDTIKWMIGVFLALALMILGLYIKR